MKLLAFIFEQPSYDKKTRKYDYKVHSHQYACPIGMALPKRRSMTLDIFLELELILNIPVNSLLGPFLDLNNYKAARK